MTDINILDLSLPRMREAEIAPADVPKLIAAEQAGKTRKSVLAFLEMLAGSGEFEIECVIDNLHLGDGRQLGRGERATVSIRVARQVVADGQAVHVG